MTRLLGAEAFSVLEVYLIPCLVEFPCNAYGKDT